MLISVCGVIASTSWVVIRSRTTRSIRARPSRTWFWISSPTVRRRRLPKWSMSSVSIGMTGRRRLHLVLAGVQPDEVLDGGDDVVLGQRALPDRQAQAELLVDLVPADLGEVVPLRVEVQVLEQRLGGLPGRRLARTQLAVDVEQRVVLAGGVVLLQGGPHRLVVAEPLEDLRVVPAERLEQDGDALLALAVDADADAVPLVDLELEPRAAGRDDLAAEDVLVGRLVAPGGRSRRPASGPAATRRHARCR